MKIFRGDKETQKLMAQTLMEIKRYARNVVNGCEGLVPLCTESNSLIAQDLEKMANDASRISDLAQGIYAEQTKEAFE